MLATSRRVPEAMPSSIRRARSRRARSRPSHRDTRRLRAPAPQGSGATTCPNRSNPKSPRIVLFRWSSSSPQSSDEPLGGNRQFGGESLKVCAFFDRPPGGHCGRANRAHARLPLRRRLAFWCALGIAVAGGCGEPNSDLGADGGSTASGETSGTGASLLVATNAPAGRDTRLSVVHG